MGPREQGPGVGSHDVPIIVPIHDGVVPDASTIVDVVQSPYTRMARVVRYGLYSLCLSGVFLAVYNLYPYLVSHSAGSAKIVVSAPLSLQSTDVALNSIRLALEERGSRAGSIDVELVVLDDGDETGNWVGDKELANATQAVEDPSVVAFLGPLNSGAAKVSMPVLNRAGIVQISPSNTWPGLTKIGFFPGEPGEFYPTGNRHYFRVCTTDDRQGPAGAQWADEMGIRRVYIVDDSDAYGIGIANLFATEAEKLGIEIVGTASITADQASYEPIALAVASSSAELIYYGGITPNGGPELLARIKSLRPDIAFMGPDGIYEQDFITRAGPASEGAYITAVGAPPEEVATPGAKAFVEAYRAEYGSDPDVFGAFAYEATMVLLDALERAGSADRTQLLAEVRATKNHNGIFGSWSFDQNGDTTQTLMSGNRIQNGSFTFTKVLQSE